MFSSIVVFCVLVASIVDRNPAAFLMFSFDVLLLFLSQINLFFLLKPAASISLDTHKGHRRDQACYGTSQC